MATCSNCYCSCYSCRWLTARYDQPSTRQHHNLERQTRCGAYHSFGHSLVYNCQHARKNYSHGCNIKNMNLARYNDMSDHFIVGRPNTVLGLFKMWSCCDVWNRVINLQFYNFSRNASIVRSSDAYVPSNCLIKHFAQWLVFLIAL